ncbi:MAG: phage portal protein [Pseudomonadota bacterium]
MDWPLTRRREAKAAAGWMTALAHLSEPRWGGRDGASLARDGYARNAVANRCVRIVAEAAATAPLRTEHPGAADLLVQPNPEERGADFFERVYSFLQIAGNAYAEIIRLEDGGPPAALYLLRPDRVRPLTDQRGWPSGWAYRTATGERLLPREDMLHLKCFHPSEDAEGLPPLAAARQALDLHNSTADWAKSLIDNSAKPSGALVYGKDGERMTDAQYDRLKEELEGSYTGPRGAGRPMLLEGGLDWKPMSLTPAEMDYREARNMAAREIALALGVPPQLLGIPGDNTYANYKEANLALWRLTVVPLAQKTAGLISGFFSRAFDEDIEIRVDLDAIPALSADREALWRRLDAATFLTDAERREMAGLPPRPAL